MTYSLRLFWFERIIFFVFCNPKPRTISNKNIQVVPYRKPKFLLRSLNVYDHWLSLETPIKHFSENASFGTQSNPFTFQIISKLFSLHITVCSLRSGLGNCPKIFSSLPVTIGNCSFCKKQKNIGNCYITGFTLHLWWFLLSFRSKIGLVLSCFVDKRPLGQYNADICKQKPMIRNRFESLCNFQTWTRPSLKLAATLKPSKI